MTSSTSSLPALLGFAFVATAFALDLGTAVLCLVGALLFHVVARLWRGDLRLEELRDRAEAARSGFADSSSR